MKNLLKFILCLLPFSTVLNAKPVTLTKDSYGNVYIANATTNNKIVAGDTVYLQGDYKSIKISNLQGTAASPIVFTNLGHVKIGGYPSYSFALQGSYWKVLGNGDPAYTYGITLDPRPAYIQGISISATSSNWEVAWCEFTKGGAGILCNPSTGGKMYDVWIHDNWVHNFDNAPLTAKTAEAFYLGTTTAAQYDAPFQFVNCIVENNLIEDVWGDGIQCGNGNFIVRNNVIRRWGLAAKIDYTAFASQRSAIEVGSFATVQIHNNRMVGGYGDAMNIFGIGNMEIANNYVDSIDLHLITAQDIIYINSRNAGLPALVLNVHDNTFKGLAGRSLIYNGTPATNTTGSTFTQNVIPLNAKINLNSKDVWKPYASSALNTPK